MSRRVGTIALGLLAAALAGCTAGRVPAAPVSKVRATGGFPVTLKDAQGVPVTVARRPGRIISIAPTVTEMLFAIGARKQVVAVTEQCDYPPEVEALPIVGQWWQPSAERALAARPDLVIGQRGNPPALVRALRNAKLRVFTIAPQRIDDIYATLRELGQLTGNAAGAERVVGEMERRLAAVHARVGKVPAEKRPTAFIIVQVSPVWTAGRGTFQDEAIRVAGAVNVGASVKDFREFSVEKLVEADPDYLLVTTMAGRPEQMKQEVLRNPALARLTAVKRGRVLLLEADEIDRPGPRLVEAVERMAAVFHRERFATTR